MCVRAGAHEAVTHVVLAPARSTSSPTTPVFILTGLPRLPFSHTPTLHQQQLSLIEAYTINKIKMSLQPLMCNQNDQQRSPLRFLDTDTDLFRDKYLDDVDAFSGVLLRHPIFD